MPKGKTKTTKKSDDPTILLQYSDRTQILIPVSELVEQFETHYKLLIDTLIQIQQGGFVVSPKKLPIILSTCLMIIQRARAKVNYSNTNNLVFITQGLLHTCIQIIEFYNKKGKVSLEDESFINLMHEDTPTFLCQMIELQSKNPGHAAQILSSKYNLCMCKIPKALPLEAGQRMSFVRAGYLPTSTHGQTQAEGATNELLYICAGILRQKGILIETEATQKIASIRALSLLIPFSDNHRYEIEQNLLSLASRMPSDVISAIKYIQSTTLNCPAQQDAVKTSPACP